MPGLSELMSLYPDRVPLILTGDALVKEKKLIVPKSMTTNHILALLRDRKLITVVESRKAQFLLLNGVLSHLHQTIGDVHASIHEADKSKPLRATVCQESAFGFCTV